MKDTSKKNLFNTKTLYINLNNEENKKYINDYHLKEVPTIVEGNRK